VATLAHTDWPVRHAIPAGTGKTGGAPRPGRIAAASIHQAKRDALALHGHSAASLSPPEALNVSLFHVKHFSRGIRRVGEAVSQERLLTRCNASLEELLDPNCPDEGKEGEHQARQDGNERHDHVDRGGTSAMDASERRCAAVNEFTWDVERLVHRHLPLLQYLRTRNQAQDWARNVAQHGPFPR
jgi:hypothetical protein